MLAFKLALCYIFFWFVQFDKLQSPKAFSLSLLYSVHLSEQRKLGLFLASVFSLQIYVTSEQRPWYLCVGQGKEKDRFLLSLVYYILCLVVLNSVTFEDRIYIFTVEEVGNIDNSQTWLDLMEILLLKFKLLISYISCINTFMAKILLLYLVPVIDG